MQKNNFNLGGEQSGHIILGKFATTGDGLLVCIRSAVCNKKKEEKLVIFLIHLKNTPQILENIEVKNKVNN